jgi:CheY-like chemotaxis protein
MSKSRQTGRPTGATREREIARLSRLYEVLTQVNHAICRIADRDELLSKICRVFVEQATDMAMPVMDGPATIFALRTINPHVRIVGMSGLDLSMGRTVTHNIADIVDAFLPKPFVAEDLLRALDKVLDSTGQNAPVVA